MRRIHLFACVLLVAGAISVEAPILRAEEGAPFPAEDPYSPWNHSLWQEAGPEMRRYICDHAARRPAWCLDPKNDIKVHRAKEPETFGPAFSGEDARWVGLTRDGDPAGLGPDDVNFIRRRAESTGDPNAMEVLGYLYANGHGAERDPVVAYIWYGRAFLEGKTEVKANMDLLWREITAEEKSGVSRIESYFAVYRPHRERPSRRPAD
jgi:hypothetical protein